MLSSEFKASRENFGDCASANIPTARDCDVPVGHGWRTRSRRTAFCGSISRSASPAQRGRTVSARPSWGTGEADACCARSRRSSRLTRFSDASTVDHSDGVVRTNRDCDLVQNQSRHATSRTRCARDDARRRPSLVIRKIPSHQKSGFCRASLSVTFPTVVTRRRHRGAATAFFHASRLDALLRRT